jgi:hypothetical protein
MDELENTPRIEAEVEIGDARRRAGQREQRAV